MNAWVGGRDTACTTATKLRETKVLYYVVRNIFLCKHLFFFHGLTNKQQTINCERASGKPANGWTPPVGTKVTTDTYRG